MGIFKLIFDFLVSVFLTNKDEANFKSIKFNPLKLSMVAVFYVSLAVNVILINKFSKLALLLAKACPSLTV